MMNRKCLILNSRFFLGWQTCAAAGCAFLLSFRQQQTIYSSHPLLWVTRIYSLTCLLKWVSLEGQVDVCCYLDNLIWMPFSRSFLNGYFGASTPIQSHSHQSRCSLQFSTKVETGLKGLVHLNIMNPPWCWRTLKPPGQWLTVRNALLWPLALSPILGADPGQPLIPSTLLPMYKANTWPGERFSKPHKG